MRSLARRLSLLPPRRYGRFAGAGITFVLLFLLIFGLWVAFTTKQAVEQVEYSNTVREHYDTAQQAIAAEESLERKYRLEPSPDMRDKHRQAAEKLVEALQNIIRDGDVEDRDLATKALSDHEGYLDATERMFSAVDAGDTARALAIDAEEIDPIFESIAKSVVGAADEHHEDALGRLDDLDRNTNLIFFTTPLVFGIVLLLLGLFGAVLRLSVLRLYRRLSRQIEERYRAVVEQAAEGILLFDAKSGSIIEFNAALQELLGYASADELKQKTIYDLAAVDKAAIDHDIQRTQAGQNFVGERRYRRKDRSLVDVQLSASAISHGERKVICTIIRDITERKALEKQLQHQALHDNLTDLPNRVLFMARLEHALERPRRSQGSLVGVLFIDLDNFKVINDSLGHKAGDDLLIAVAERIRACLRPADTAARISGDEFTILLEDLTDESGATAVAERISEELRTPFKLEGRDVHLTASIGIAFNGSDGELPDDLLRRADATMYWVKQRGKADYGVFDPSMTILELGKRLKLENDLRRAIERHELVMYYQPIVQLESGRIVGMEALVRWKHPQEGLVPPSKFIPIAEETGLIIPIGQQTLDEACKQAREWQDTYSSGSPLLMSLNLSARELQRLELLEDVEKILQETGLVPSNLIIEITESIAMEDVESTIAVVPRLKSLGAKLAVDDFGTGYSSLSYLSRLPVDYLKIDSSFVGGLGEDTAKNEGLVSAMTGLARTLGLQTIAEGVETAEQLAQLRELGCDMAQGYYFSKPLPSEAAAALLESDPCWYIGAQRA